MAVTHLSDSLNTLNIPTSLTFIDKAQVQYVTFYGK